ncbi:hypothetical protein BC629DRAFT_243213 [Irpex lacteus]|nr:hypothetical protein BC629DRAFT_243213 [Irpex lacteus]
MAFVAAAATLPPELFDSILFYVCEFAVDLLDPEAMTPSRKQTIKDITACSLTCVYWARICRERIFKKIWIKNYEDLCAFSSLASSTPKGFKPISALAERATLVLHIADRPWLHLLRLQPSLIPEMPLVRNYASIHFRIIDSSSADSDTPRRPTYRCVFSGLPRALPASCHQCDDLTIRNPYFQTERDVKSLLAKFGRRPYPRKHIVAWNITLLDVTWDVVKSASTPLHDLLIKGDNLELKFAGISASVTVEAAPIRPASYP